MDNQYAKVENYPNLLRDLNTNAIINVDKKSLSTYIKNKKNKEIEKNKLEKLQTEVNEIKNDISEIKHLLKNLQP
jgi:conjugal transfer/entry exclusion protein